MCGKSNNGKKVCLVKSKVWVLVFVLLFEPFTVCGAAVAGRNTPSNELQDQLSKEGKIYIRKGAKVYAKPSMTTEIVGEITVERSAQKKSDSPYMNYVLCEYDGMVSVSPKGLWLRLSRPIKGYVSMELPPLRDYLGK